MPLPVVAIVGSTGYVGKFLTEAFLTHGLKDGRVKELRVLTSKKSSTTEEYVKQGAKLHEVNFSKKETVLNALKSVDIVISAMGTGPGSSTSKDILLEALTQCGVDVYFPSEFGTNHYSSRCKVRNPAFEGKKKHFQEAKGKSGLKTVRLLCSCIMEYTFADWSGLNCQTGVWKIAGSGNTPVALTASRDIGRFTLEAALLAYKNPDAVPDELEVVGVTRTLKEYAAALETASGSKIKIQNLSLEDAIEKHEKTKDFLAAFPILFETGAYDIKPEQANGNVLLNPDQSVWTFKTFEEYAQETGGKP